MSWGNDTFLCKSKRIKGMIRPCFANEANPMLMAILSVETCEINVQ